MIKMKLSIKGLKLPPIRKHGELTNLVYEAAEETAGIVKPIRLRSAYREEYDKDVSEADVMKMVNKMIKEMEKEGTSPIIKHEAPDGGTIYLHMGVFEEWMEKKGFLPEFIAFFQQELMKTKGSKPDVEKHKIEDFLVRYNIPRGLGIDVVLDALCKKNKLIQYNDTYSMPEIREMRKTMVVENSIKAILKTKGYIVDEELIDDAVKKSNGEFARTEVSGSSFSGLNVSTHEVRSIFSKLGTSTIMRTSASLNHKLGDADVRMIVDVPSLEKIIGGLAPSVVAGLKSRFKEKIEEGGSLSKEDLVDVIDKLITERGA